MPRVQWRRRRQVERLLHSLPDVRRRKVSAVIRIDLSGLRPVLVLIAEQYWRFTTLGISPLAPHAAKAVIKRAELRSPSRPNRRIS